MATKRNTERKRDNDGIYQRPNSPYWWASWIDGCGKPARRSTQIRREDDPRKEQAKAVRAQWVIDAQAEKQQKRPKADKPAERTFDELMVSYIDGPSLEKKSHERDLYSLKPLAAAFQGRELTGIKGADVRQYIQERKTAGIAPATINRELGLMSAAINWAIKELEWPLANPFKGRRQTPPPGRDRWLTHEEADRLIEAAKRLPHLHDFILLSLNTGMRTGEVLGLEWNRVDFTRRTIYLGAADQKNGKPSTVPINEKAREALLNCARRRATDSPDSPWVFANRKGERIASIKKSFAATTRAAKLENVHPHDLRRTFGSWLVQQGVTIQTVSALLRHSDISVTVKVYAHLAQENLMDAVEKLDLVSHTAFTPTQKHCA